MADIWIVNIIYVNDILSKYEVGLVGLNTHGPTEQQEQWQRSYNWANTNNTI